MKKITSVLLAFVVVISACVISVSADAAKLKKGKVYTSASGKYKYAHLFRLHYKGGITVKKIISILITVVMLISVFTTVQAFYNYNGEKTYISADGQYKYTVHGGKYAELLWFFAEKSKDLNEPVFEVPSEVDGYPVKYLYPYLYSALNCKESETIKSKKIIIPETVVYIGDSVFSGCFSEDDSYGIEAAEIVIPQSVEYIGSYAFENCRMLKKLTLPDKIISIGRYAFKNCKRLENVTIPNGWKKIPEGCFEDCTKLKKVKLPNNYIKLGNYAFYGCTSLKKLDTNYYVEFGKYSFGFKGFIPDPTGGILGRAYKKIKGCVINTSNLGRQSEILDYANKYGVNATYSVASSSKKSTEMYTGACFTMFVDGKKATEWKSSNSKVVKISTNGKVAVLKKGKVNLTCKLNNGKKLKLKTSVTWNPYLCKKDKYGYDLVKSITLFKNQTKSLMIYGKALGYNISYKNAKCAKVVSKKSSYTLKVKGVKVGKGTIRIKVNGVKLKLKVVVK